MNICTQCTVGTCSNMFLGGRPKFYCFSVGAVKVSLSQHKSESKHRILCKNDSMFFLFTSAELEHFLGRYIFSSNWDSRLIHVGLKLRTRFKLLPRKRLLHQNKGWLVDLGSLYYQTTWPHTVYIYIYIIRIYIYIYTCINTNRFIRLQTNMWLAETPPFSIGNICIYSFMVGFFEIGTVGFLRAVLLSPAAWQLRSIHVDGSQWNWFNLHQRRE